MRHAITPIFVASALALAACGGSDTGSEGSNEPSSEPDPTEDTGAAPDAPDTTDGSETDAASDDASTDSDGNGDAGLGASGGPIADDFGRICELLDAQAVADIMSIEATSQPNGVGGGTGLCQFGAEGSVTLVVTDVQEQVGLGSEEFFRMRVDTERSNGFEVSEAPLMGLPRATWIGDAGSATVIVALEPYLIEMTDANGQDLALSVLIGGVADALR